MHKKWGYKKIIGGIMDIHQGYKGITLFVRLSAQRVLIINL